MRPFWADMGRSPRFGRMSQDRVALSPIARRIPLETSQDVCRTLAQRVPHADMSFSLMRGIGVAGEALQADDGRFSLAVGAQCRDVERTPRQLEIKADPP